MARARPATGSARPPSQARTWGEVRATRARTMTRGVIEIILHLDLKVLRYLRVMRNRVARHEVFLVSKPGSLLPGRHATTPDAHPDPDARAATGQRVFCLPRPGRQRAWLRRGQRRRRVFCLAAGFCVFWLVIEMRSCLNSRLPLSPPLRPPPLRTRCRGTAWPAPVNRRCAARQPGSGSRMAKPSAPLRGQS